MDSVAELNRPITALPIQRPQRRFRSLITPDLYEMTGFFNHQGFGATLGIILPERQRLSNGTGSIAKDRLD